MGVGLPDVEDDMSGLQMKNGGVCGMDGLLDTFQHFVGGLESVQQTDHQDGKAAQNQQGQPNHGGNQKRMFGSSIKE